jgi:hypothetical protein
MYFFGIVRLVAEKKQNSKNGGGPPTKRAVMCNLFELLTQAVLLPVSMVSGVYRFVQLKRNERLNYYYVGVC